MLKNLKRLISVVLMLSAIGVTLTGLFPTGVSAERVVKVAYFPMEGYHMYSADGSHIGMDVDYMDAICKYTGWTMEYVDCDSWGEALRLLEEEKVDLVGTAQYSAERAQIFQYAELSSGYTFGAIFVSGDSTIAYEDFGAMKNVTFGMVSTYVRREDFFKYLAENGIEEPRVKLYDNTAELQNALKNGEVDAITHTFTEIIEGLRIVGRFANSQFYYISHKNNAELMREFNTAVSNLKLEHPNFENHLMNKYYNSKLGGQIVLTSAEKEYVEKKKHFYVGYLDGYYPFSYVKDGEFCGLARGMFDAFGSNTAATVEYVEMKSLTEARQALVEGNIDVLCYDNVDYEETDEVHPVFVASYATVPLSVFVRRGKTASDIRVTAVAKDTIRSTDWYSHNSSKVLLEFNDEQECIKAAMKGLADAVVCNSYIGAFYSSGYDDVELQSVIRDEESIGVTISSSADTVLHSILKKIIIITDEQAISEYMLQNPFEPPFDLVSWLEKNRFKLACFFALILLVVLLVILRMLYDSRKIQSLMYKDTELDVWNMNYLFYWAEQQRVNSPKSRYAVLYIKSPQFRVFGTLYGWEEKNKMLTVAADTLETVVKEDRRQRGLNELAARGQGDRFVLLLEVKTADELFARLDALSKRLESELKKAMGVHAVIKMGVAEYDEKNRDIRLSVSRANQALEYLKEKNTGVSDYHIYDNELSEQLRLQHTKEEVLESADIKRDFVAYYQAKVDIDTKKIVGAEALARYVDPKDPKNVISPGYFVPYYEKTGKIKELDFFVLESVCAMLSKRADEGKKQVPISCNFSRRHFTESDFADRLVSVMEKYNIPRQLIEIEITETVIMDELDMHRVYSTIAKLHEMGIKMSIDDFGSGYSSLGVFERVPASALKLDRSFFVNNIDKERQVKIMRQIVSLADSLNAKVVCEGVETDGHVEIMTEIGAHIAQGFKFAFPEPEAVFVGKLDRE